MEPAVKLYQEFIDCFANCSHVERIGIWVRERGWPDLPENKPINDLLAKLSDEEKDVLVKMLQHERNGGIHDALVQINERVDLNELRIVEGGVEMAVEPYGNPMHFDYVCRREGDDWATLAD